MSTNATKIKVPFVTNSNIGTEKNIKPTYNNIDMQRTGQKIKFLNWRHRFFLIISPMTKVCFLYRVVLKV